MLKWISSEFVGLAGGNIQSLGPRPLVPFFRKESEMAGCISYQTPNPGLDHLFGLSELWLSSSMNHSLLRPGVDPTVPV